MDDNRVASNRRRSRSARTFTSGVSNRAERHFPSSLMVSEMKIDKSRVLEQISEVLSRRTESVTLFEQASQLCFKRRSELLDATILGRIEVLDQGFRVYVEPEDEIVVEDDELLPTTLEFIARANREARGAGRLVYNIESQTVCALSYLCCIDEPSDQTIIETVEESIFLLVRCLVAIFGERDGGKRRPSQKR